MKSAEKSDGAFRPKARKHRAGDHPVFAGRQFTSGDVLNGCTDWCFYQAWVFYGRSGKGYHALHVQASGGKQSANRDDILQTDVPNYFVAIHGVEKMDVGSDEAGRKELAKALDQELWSAGYRTYYLGIGSVIYGVDADLMAQEPDSRRQHREEHLRRFAEVANVLLDSGLVLVCTAAELDADDVALIRADLSGERVLVFEAGGHSLPAELVDHAAKKGASTDATVAQFIEAFQEAVSADTTP